MEEASLNSVGLPLRPGAQPCQYFLRRGKCAFGTQCKHDHPESGVRPELAAKSREQLAEVELEASAAPRRKVARKPGSVFEQKDLLRARGLPSRA